jgi:phosphate transport system permease protein
MSSAQSSDRSLVWSLGTVATLAGSVVVLIVGFLVLESYDALASVGPTRFLTDQGWFPSDGTEGRFGLAPMLAGTLLLTGGAILLAAPAGLAVAIFCRFVAPPTLAKVMHRLIEVLAGVPSVVYGFWGLVTLVPILQSLRPPGQSLLAGVLILGLMVLPTVVLMSEAALRAVPRPLLDGATALGLDRWATARGVALPYALPGIGSGLLLATARALGETMAVLMVCGNVVQMPASVFDPVRALTANIALEMAYATAHHRSALFVSGLVLMVGVALLIAAIERLGDRVANA